MNKTFLGAFLASVFISFTAWSIRLPTVRQSQLFPVPKEPENELVVEPEE